MSGQLGLRGGLRRLSTGLIAYGAAGLAVALLGLVALAWTAGRVSSLADRVDAEVVQLGLWQLDLLDAYPYPDDRAERHRDNACDRARVDATALQEKLDALASEAQQ